MEGEKRRFAEIGPHASFTPYRPEVQPPNWPDERPKSEDVALVVLFGLWV